MRRWRWRERPSSLTLSFTALADHSNRFCGLSRTQTGAAGGRGGTAQPPGRIEHHGSTRNGLLCAEGHRARGGGLAQVSYRPSCMRATAAEGASA